MFETCIFDLYGTLVDIKTDEEDSVLWEKLTLFYNYYQAGYTQNELQKTYQSVTKELMKGKHSFRKDSHESFPEIQIEEVFSKLFAIHGVHADKPLAIHAGQFFRALSTKHLALYPGTLQMLQTLKKSGKKVYLLSNAQRIFTEYEMKALGIYDCFEKIYISSDYDYKKPDLRFFERILNECNVDLKTAIMIGNDGICDIKGAKNAGLHTLYVHSNISPKEDFPDADYVLPEMDMKKIEHILLG